MLQFSDTINNLGIVQDITSITKATLTDYPIADRTRDINNAYSRAAYLIIMADGRMQWDDTNATDQPVTQTSLVSGQEDYNIFTAAPVALKDWLSIERVELKDEDGLWRLLQPIDKRNLGVAWAEYLKTNNKPYYYEFFGTSLYLKPAPDYSLSNALRIYFQRAPQYFAATDTTKRPGFASIFHSYLSLVPSYRWARDHGLKNEKSLKRDIQEMEQAIQKHYSSRGKFETPVLRRAYKSFK